MNTQDSESLITDRRTSIAGEYVNLLLPQLLAILEHPKIAADLVPDLAQNSQHREHLTALGNLWRSLGRPTSGFWRHTYVFCNGIQDDSYLRAKLMANSKADRCRNQDL